MSPPTGTPSTPKWSWRCSCGLDATAGDPYAIFQSAHDHLETRADVDEHHELSTWLGSRQGADATTYDTTALSRRRLERRAAGYTTSRPTPA